MTPLSGHAGSARQFTQQATTARLLAVHPFSHLAPTLHVTLQQPSICMAVHSIDAYSSCDGIIGECPLVVSVAACHQGQSKAGVDHGWIGALTGEFHSPSAWDIVKGQIPLWTRPLGLLREAIPYSQRDYPAEYMWTVRPSVPKPAHIPGDICGLP